MYPANANKILSLLSPDDLVLDVGGWACPFNRANYVLDAQPYETRGWYATVGLPRSQGGDREHFSRETWFQRDVCDKTPFPFHDKMFDFAICSHTLEDIRDPIWVCSELVRIARKGYIEVPSRIAETCRGWESARIAGLTHHRWLIEIDARTNEVQFLHKHHMIHADRKFSFPPSYFRGLRDEQRVTWLFWKDAFVATEKVIHGLQAVAGELAGFVQKSYRYPIWRMVTDRACSRAQGVFRRIATKMYRRSDRTGENG